jgi:hypothetical protein
MIRNHPTISKVYIFLELDCNHLRVYLDYHTFQPVSNPFIAMFMVTKNFNAVTHVKRLF